MLTPAEVAIRRIKTRANDLPGRWLWRLAYATARLEAKAGIRPNIRL